MFGETLRCTCKFVIKFCEAQTLHNELFRQKRLVYFCVDEYRSFVPKRFRKFYNNKFLDKLVTKEVKVFKGYLEQYTVGT